MTFPEVYQAVGIDPGLAEMGLAFIEHYPRGNGESRLRDYRTVRTKASEPIVGRIRGIAAVTSAFISEHLRSTHGTHAVQAIVVEDPALGGGMGRGTSTRAGNRKSSASIAGVSIAFGICATVALQFPGVHSRLISVGEWMPRQRSGNLEHTAPHDFTLHFVRRRFVEWPAGASDHVVMAAGVARHWIDQEILQRTRAERGITV